MEEVVSFQNAFNALLTIGLAAIGWFINALYSQHKEETRRVHNRIDQLTEAIEQSNRDQRQDRTACQARLPETYVTRREWEGVQQAWRTDMAEIKSDIRQIREVVMDQQKTKADK